MAIVFVPVPLVRSGFARRWWRETARVGRGGDGHVRMKKDAHCLVWRLKDCDSDV